MNLSNHIRKTAIKQLVLGILFLFVWTNPAIAIGLTSKTLRYSVQYAAHDAGELEIVIDRREAWIKTTTISHLSATAQLFLSGLTAETWFSIGAERVRVERGHLLANDNETIKSSFEIDRKNGVLKFQQGEDFPIDNGELFESTTFPIVLMTSDISTIAGKDIREVNPKRVRWYTYHQPKKELLDMDGRKYKTWKVTRNKRGDPERTVTIWLDRQNQNIPLKIISAKKDKLTTMTLMSRS